MDNQLIENRSVKRILTELNVININAIDIFIQEMLEHAEVPDGLKRWFASRAKKHIVNSNDDNIRITQFSQHAEPWMKQRHKEGVPLYKFEPTERLRAKLSHVVDWMGGLYNIAKGEGGATQAEMANAIRTIKGLGNMSMTQAISASDKWSKQRTDTSTVGLSAEQEQGIAEVLDAGNGYKWYTLTTPECLSREGKLMGHCVGDQTMGYGRRVGEGTTQIYSLRDRGNVPHVTIEVKDGSVNQVKGKQNRAPVQRYVPATVALLNHLSLPAIGAKRDIEAMRLVYDRKKKQYGSLLEMSTKVVDAEYKIYEFISGDDEVYIITDQSDNTLAEVYLGYGRYSSARSYILDQKTDIGSHSELKRFADFMSANSHKVRAVSSVEGPIGKYLTSVDGKLKTHSEHGKRVYGDDKHQIRFHDTGKRQWFTEVEDGKIVSSREGKTTDDGDLVMKIGKYNSGSTEKYANIDAYVKYVNHQSAKQRPYIMLDSNIIYHVHQSGRLYQGLDKRVSNKVSDVGKVLAKSDSVVAYQALTSRDEYGVGHDIKSIYVVSDNGTYFEYFLKDSNNSMLRIDSLDKGDVSNVATVLNKVEMSLDEQDIAQFESHGIFIDEKGSFVDDVSIAGNKSNTHGEIYGYLLADSIRVYAKSVEIVRFGFKQTDRPPYSSQYNTAIREVEIFDRYQFISNRANIASVLNEFDIGVSDFRGRHSAKSQLAMLGLRHGHYGWKGTKTQPSVIFKGKYKGKKFVVSKYTTANVLEYMVYDQSNNTHLASLISDDKSDNFEFETHVDDISFVSYVLKEMSDHDIQMHIKGAPDKEYYYDDDAGVDKRRIIDTRYQSPFYQALWKSGYVHDYTNGIQPMSEVYPDTALTRTKTGKWMKEAFNSNDITISKMVMSDDTIRNEYGISAMAPGDEKYDYYTFYRAKKPLLRALVSVGDVPSVDVIYAIGDSGVSIIDSVKLDQYKAEIGKLIKLTGSSGSKFLVTHGMYYSKGRLHSVASNPKIDGYIKGEIVYEDNHRWYGYVTSDPQEWYLKMIHDGEEVHLLKVKVSPDDGIESIEFLNKKIKKSPRLYKPHLNDLMDIVDDLYGGEY